MQDAQAHAAGPNQQQQQQQQEQQAPSPPFLRCLSQLNDDVLATYLLPKLVEQGCAGALVLTCSWLRALCQPGVQHLDLSKPQLQDADNPCHSPGVATQLVDTFPQCTSLAFAFSARNMVNVHRCISMLLSGLPHLNTSSIDFDSGNSNDNTGSILRPLLCQLHTHAPALRCLSLQLSTGWGEDCNATWASLGKLDSLTSMQLVGVHCTHLDLRHLTGLSNLQSLRIDTPERTMWLAAEADSTEDEEAALQLAVGQLLGRLTALTELQLPLEVVRGISGVSTCVNLGNLQLWQLGGPELHLPPAQWAALAQLTHLTCLTVDAIEVGPEQQEAYYSAIKQLTGLRRIGGDTWGPGFLPVLQGLTQVTTVYGGWDVGQEVDVRGLVCPHVRELGGARGSIPFQAFPNLVCLECDCLHVHSMQALSRCCTGLQKLVGRELMCSARGSTLAERLSAFRSLAQLKHLTHLELVQGDELELMAFTSAAAAAASTSGSALQLRCLHVRGLLSLSALMQLSGVPGLTELHVQLEQQHYSTDCIEQFSAKVVGAWLVGLAVVPKVSIQLCSQEQRTVVKAAQEWAAQVGLPLPAALKVSVASEHKYTCRIYLGPAT